jgi:hypothetical protein
MKTSTSDQQRLAYRFVITVADPTLTEAQVQSFLEEAIREAAQAASHQLPDLNPLAEFEGGFAGLGEATVILSVLLHAAQAAAAAAGLGAASAFGKMFFENFLAPRLRKLNLLPSKFHKVHNAGSRPAGKRKRHKP